MEVKYFTSKVYHYLFVDAFAKLRGQVMYFFGPGKALNGLCSSMWFTRSHYQLGKSKSNDIPQLCETVFVHIKTNT